MVGVLVGIAAATGLTLPVLLCEVLSFNRSLGGTLGKSYVVSTILMFVVLYLDGILGVFQDASYVRLVIVLVSGIDLVIVVMYHRDDSRRST